MIPTRKSIELPLLRVIHDFGGELRPRAAYALVEDFSPELTPNDKVLRDIWNHIVWINNVQWARQKLADKGYLFREPRGVWRITPEGIYFLEQHWSSWTPEAGRFNGG